MSFVPRDPRPTGGVTLVCDYWVVGDGLPDSGHVGYDVHWFDASGLEIAQNIAVLDGKVAITEAKYDALIAQWGP